VSFIACFRRLIVGLEVSTTCTKDKDIVFSEHVVLHSLLKHQTLRTVIIALYIIFLIEGAISRGCLSCVSLYFSWTAFLGFLRSEATGIPKP